MRYGDGINMVPNMTLRDGRSEPSPYDVAVSAAVQALMHDRGESVADLAHYTKLSVAAIYRKLGGQSSWKVSDVGLMARHFGVPASDILSGRPIPLQRNRRASDRLLSA